MPKCFWWGCTCVVGSHWRWDTGNIQSYSMAWACCAFFVRVGHSGVMCEQEQVETDHWHCTWSVLSLDIGSVASGFIPVQYISSVFCHKINHTGILSNYKPPHNPEKAEYAEICNLFIVAMEMTYSRVWIEVLPDQCLRARSLSKSESHFLEPPCSIVHFTVYICTIDKETVLNK